MFTHDSVNLSKGSTATFICQDTERVLTSKNTWSFQKGSLDIVLSENGTLASGVDRDKYKLKKSGTKLEIINLTVNDSGNYRCVIHGENGETLFSATASLMVKGKLTGRIVSSQTLQLSPISLLRHLRNQNTMNSLLSKLPKHPVGKTIIYAVKFVVYDNGCGHIYGVTKV